MGSLNLHLSLLLLSLLFISTQSQPPKSPPVCNGIELSYSITDRKQIHPLLKDPKAQPSSFKATATVQNNGLTELKAWSLLIQFQHQELIVSAGGAVLNNNSPFPFNTSDSDGLASFSGSSNPDLKTPIETAGDLTQIQAQIDLVGTFFGSPLPAYPLPKSISLDDPLYICPSPKLGFNSSSSITSCCTLDPNPKLNDTKADNDTDTDFLPRRSGDLSIFYDVLQAYGSSYLA